MERNTIKVDLGTIPHILHAGVLVAKSKKFYDEQSINVELCWETNQHQTGQQSEQRLRQSLFDKKVDVGFATISTVVESYAVGTTTNSSADQRLVAIAGIPVKSDACQVAFHKGALGVDKRPRNLDNKKYGLFGVPYEEGFVKAMIKKDGGNGHITPINCSFDGLIDDLKEGKIDASNIFVPWHRVRAETENLSELDFIESPHQRYRLPATLPVLVVLADSIENAQNQSKKNALISFLKATAAGYNYAFSDPNRFDEVANILAESIQYGGSTSGGSADRKGFIMKSLKSMHDFIDTTTSHHGDKSWGMMDSQVWLNFVRFLIENRLLVDRNSRPVNEENFDLRKLYTNQLLQSSSF